MNIQPQTQREAPSDSGPNNTSRVGQSGPETTGKEAATARAAHADEREELDTVVWLSMN